MVSSQKSPTKPGVLKAPDEYRVLERFPLCTIAFNNVCVS